MKRTATALALAVAAAALLTGASVWEGAAVSAAAGELPDSGNYVATNAFPRNTVVDVTNLENNKTVRVIVSAGLDSPGLLASLSRDAAAAIGMNTRDIGRVRMTMPADPIAFSRFNEGFEPSGDPDHDPQAAIAAASEPVPVPSPQERTPAASEALPETAAETPAEAETADAEAPVDLADAGEESVIPAPVVSEVPAEAVEAPSVAEEPAAEEPAEIAEAAPPESMPAETVPESGAQADAPIQAPETGKTDIVLVPAEERPPVAPEGNELPSAAEVAPLDRTEETVAEAAVEREPVPTLPRDREVASISPQTAVPAETPRFGAPVIASLEKGKYYLQLGAFGKAETVEAEIAKHGKTYPIAIQSAGSAEKPVYRVLVGPVNLGESGALLQRFKRNGYKDAFVKQGS